MCSNRNIGINPKVAKASQINYNDVGNRFEIIFFSNKFNFTGKMFKAWLLINFNGEGKLLKACIVFAY